MGWGCRSDSEEGGVGPWNLQPCGPRAGDGVGAGGAGGVGSARGLQFLRRWWRRCLSHICAFVQLLHGRVGRVRLGQVLFQVPGLRTE